MKFLHAAAFAVMLSLTSVPVLYAQEPNQEKEKPKQQDEEKKKQPPAAKEKPQPKPDERAKSEPQSDREKSKQEVDKPKQQKQQEKTTKEQQKQSEPNQSATGERGTHKNVRRIPPERFQANFGREHHFRVQRRGDRRFQYGGYQFEVVEVWPVGWSYDDDCYLEEDGDDYYLVDVVHPEVRVLVVIVG